MVSLLVSMVFGLSCLQDRGFYEVSGQPTYQVLRSAESWCYQHEEGEFGLPDPYGLRESIGLKLHTYRSLMAPDRAPLIIILSPIAGSNPLDHRAARVFARKGMHSVIVDPQYGEGFEARLPIEQSVSYEITRQVVAVKKVVDLVQSWDFVHTGQIGIYGTSIGGNAAALVLGVEERIQAGVLIVAGGNLPRIMATSKNSVVRAFREQSMEHHGYETVDDFENAMLETLEGDALCFAKHRNPEDVWMLSARYDEDVPTAQQDELWEAFGQPRRTRLYLGHIGAALFSTLKLGEMSRFFLDRFQGL